MHEYSLVQNLLEQVENQARQHGAIAVHRVKVRIGELSGVEPDLLQTAYDIVRTGTLCANAPLDIARVAARWTCKACGRDVPAGGPLRCATCGEPARLAEGDDLMLDRIELEVGE